MWTVSRRDLVGLSAFLLIVVGLPEYLRRQGEPPPAEWVHDRLWGDALIAYAVWNGIPRAAVLNGEGKVVYDQMIPGDWLWPNWPPRPQWQFKGTGYAIAASDAPATVGYAPCVGIQGERCRQAPELFGQINDPDVVAIEVLVDDQWLSFAAGPPGFAIRLEGALGKPDRYRWLDADGRTVWELPTQSPTSPPD